MSDTPEALAHTPAPPYYAVIFTSLRKEGDNEAYGETAQHMIELAAQQPGYLGVESVRDAAGVGITVSCWSSLDAVAAWGRVAAHRAAQARGRSRWYEQFRLRICRVEEERIFPPMHES
jgi:heme-degrading monooxygenase HmoA